ncbi:hypothetical protein RQL81_10785 [Citrobacter braakii]|jgi:hypothetical protein|uniref:CYTH domain-containing protein n=1 Tax=Citrobacter braakii TaxID=57706 RepID=A0ABR6TV68_CITBR|nr:MULTISPECIES: hypothetical protein [Gammaproteobacteria]AUU29512.1 hypothetical protein MC62_026855 [Citrobacter freundii]EGT0621291.1 hypothetical protein [Citrobacter braakii]EGT0649769.1 hypothetical protein [Citrobacter braakii]ELK6840195.1 hypothetical protein [Citrobacter braakii]MBC2610697.1 hypothetical protein [Citrobacter braakii]
MATHMDKNTATSSSDAEKIIPRAEFRVFGHGIIERVKEKMWDAKATLFKARKMPEETYFLSLHTDTVNVKVRDGLLDIKTKTGETPEGYEIFQPRGKFQFPVQREELATILQHLQVNMALDKESYTLEEFTNMARASSDLVPVKVEKMRYGFSVNGIISEYAQVWFNGAMVETACCESEDYAGIKAAVAALGLDELPNTNYLKAARQVVGM